MTDFSDMILKIFYFPIIKRSIILNERLRVSVNYLVWVSFFNWNTDKKKDITKLKSNIMAEGFCFMPWGLVRLRTFRLSAWVT